MIRRLQRSMVLVGGRRPKQVRHREAAGPVISLLAVSRCSRCIAFIEAARTCMHC